MTTPLLEKVGSLIGSAVLLSFVVLTGLVLVGIASLSPLTQSWFLLYTVVVTLSAIQVFGRDVWSAYRKKQ